METLGIIGKSPCCIHITLQIIEPHVCFWEDYEEDPNGSKLI